MVLFYDTEVKKPPSRRRKYIVRSIKITLALAVLGWLSLWVLMSLTGNSEALKMGVQDYLNETTGYITNIHSLEKMSFYPHTHISFRDMTFHKPMQKPEPSAEQLAKEKADLRDPDKGMPPQKVMADFFDAGDEVGHVGQGVITMRFWDMLMTNRRFYELDIKDMQINKEAWLPEKLHLTSLSVKPDADFPALSAQGTYGTHKLDLQVKLGQKKEKNGRILYEFPNQTVIKMALGPLTLDGILNLGTTEGMRLDINSLEVNKTKLSGYVGLRTRTNNREVSLNIKTENSDIVMDLDVTPTAVTGTATAAALDLTDVQKIRKAVRDIREILGVSPADDNVSFHSKPANINIDIKKLLHKSHEWGHVKANLEMQPYRLDINDVLGLVNGGALSGKVVIDASVKDKEPHLALDLQLRGWDYARLQNQVTGQADTHAKLTSTGKTFAALEKNLKGEIVTIGGAGELTRDSVLYWGNGLLTAMLPDLSGGDRLSMNCMVADFDVTGYNAKSQTLFMDLKDLTVVGEGTVDMDDLTLDLTLKPNPKEISILDGGVAVSVTGPLAKPDIEPEAFSVAKKLGGLFLGTINPAFFALSLTDLGLNDAHPCSAYLKK